MPEKIRVLIVDDSALMREALKSVLSSDSDIEVIGYACDGNEGVKKAFELRPNVITMDIKMPIMTGLEAIERIMEDMPTPIIVVSSMDVKVVIKALSVGAMDFISVEQEIDAIAKDLIEKVKIASRVRPLRRIKINRLPPHLEIKRKAVNKEFKVVALGVSTGGPQALEFLLSRIPPVFSSTILVVQHISSGFINGLVEWLKLSSRLDIQVAKAGDPLKGGGVLFAPDGYNMCLDSQGKIELKEDVSKKMLHVPSIDEMMKSVAQYCGKNALGIIMTGMGRDGVDGIKEIKKTGGFTIAQDEATSVIFGMNKVAIEEGCIDKVVSLYEIPQEIVSLCNGV